VQLRSSTPCVMVSLACVLVGCASSSRTEPTREPAPRPTEQTLGPVPGEPPGPDAARGARQTNDEGRRPLVKRDADDLRIREDGRPTWWFAEPIEEAGRVRICAEALGESMLDARREAVAASRGRARNALGLREGVPLPDEQIERTWVWPLPSPSPGGARYAAYVELSVLARP